MASGSEDIPGRPLDQRLASAAPLEGRVDHEHPDVTRVARRPQRVVAEINRNGPNRVASHEEDVAIDQVDEIGGGDPIWAPLQMALLQKVEGNPVAQYEHRRDVRRAGCANLETIHRHRSYFGTRSQTLDLSLAARTFVSMDPIDPETWKAMTRWERAELGRKLRREGWTYSEIMDVLPVGKGTLAGWCKEIRLMDEQIDAIKARRPPGVRTGIPVDTQRKRRKEIETIRKSAEMEAPLRMTDALWLAGVTLYWAEGSKANNRLELANADPRALRLFMKFARGNHDPQADFHAALNLHAINDEVRARSWWSSALDLPIENFRKTFIKPDGTGHRKNHLPFGVCRVYLCRSTNALHRTMGWIDGLASCLESRDQ